MPLISAQASQPACVRQNKTLSVYYGDPSVLENILYFLRQVVWFVVLFCSGGLFVFCFVLFEGSAVLRLTMYLNWPHCWVTGVCHCACV